MAAKKHPAPPRPLAPGDVVAAYSDLLEAWTAAQITDLDVEWKNAGVLELDWSGPRAPTITDLGDATPLRLTHHGYRGALAHTNMPWLLPRAYQVIGSMAPLCAARSDSYGDLWRLGNQLAFQRRWDSGDHTTFVDPHALTLTMSELPHALSLADVPHRGITSLIVSGIEALDCERLVEAYPAVRQLMLWGRLGVLENAGALNRLSSLREVHIDSLFGMTADERLDPGRLLHLQFLGLRNVPAAYAVATRSLWRPQIVQGTALEVTGARKPEWVEENRDNPLREWDGREHISPATFKKSVRQYRATRQELLRVVRDLPAEELEPELTRIGREYGEAFNRLSARNLFIETEEREDLALALDDILAAPEVTRGRDFTTERQQLLSALDQVRDW